MCRSDGSWRVEDQGVMGVLQGEMGVIQESVRYGCVTWGYGCVSAGYIISSRQRWVTESGDEDAVITIITME